METSPLVDGESAASYGPELIPLGTSVRVRVPASTGNVGPGYDSLGLALGRYDDITVERTEGPLSFELSGEGAEEVPQTEAHLIVRAMRTAWKAIGLLELPGLKITAHNRIPHSRGMGSSASAIVAGVVAANAMVPEQARLSQNAVLQICSQMEGHPDNVAPSLFGGLVISYSTADGFHSVPVSVASEIVPVVAVPDYEVPTRIARGLIPESVPHREASVNSGRAALLVHAMKDAPSELFAGTEDLLHQQYRASAMPPSAALVAHLRGRGLPAIISGAGPTVLTLAPNEAEADRAVDAIAQCAEDPDQNMGERQIAWTVEKLTVDRNGVIVEHSKPAGLF
ncbi:homoserine kinase [Kocuria massiliensis]|uniref:homoserine kinase n=1 Tax=Kocuria massiliensis TaxID=1926282 RepID=UPI0022B95648|nr:homoserine kinase [Kocuria massiliensis]